MARHNVIFGRDQAVQQGARNGNGQWASSFEAQPQQYQYGQPQGGQPQYGQSAPQFGQPAPQFGQADDLEAMYSRPAATGYDTGRMTMKDALNAITATMGVIIVVGTGVALLPLAMGLALGQQGLTMGYGISMIASLIGAIGGLITGLINSFSKKPSAVLVMIYAFFEGLLLGGITGVFERIYPGIALQAVLATFVVAGTVVALNHFGILRTSPRLNKIFAVAMIAYLLFMVVNLGLVLFTGTDLRTGLLGMAIGGIAVAMASYSLVSDVEDVRNASEAGVPRVYAWRCAFGVAATLVWMYVEILRLLAILRGDD